MNKKIISGMMIVATSFISGCETIPKDAFNLTESSLEVRNLQTRLFDTTNEIELISSVISVLQDLGYQIDSTEKALGLVTGSKKADAKDTGEIVAAVLLSALSGAPVHYNEKQHIAVSVVTIPAKNGKGYFARATFQKIVWNTQGVVTKAEAINNSELYANFFDSLNKAVFLEKL